MNTDVDDGDQRDDLPVRLRKHSAAIQISNNISLVQRKMYNCLLHNASEQILTRGMHSMSIKDLLGLLNYDGTNNYQYIENNARALMETTVKWSLLNKTDQNAFAVSTLISSLKVSNGILTYEFSRSLREKFAEPYAYGMIELESQNNFNSKYTLALYENAATYMGGSSKAIPIDTLKELLGAPANYAVKELNRNCIAPAVEECNLYSDIHVTVEQVKEGRRIVGVILHVRSNPARLEAIEKEMAASKALEDELVAIGVAARKAKNFCALYPEKYLREKIEVLTETQATEKGVQNPPAFLVRAIEEDWKLARKSEPVKAPEQINMEVISPLEREDEERRAIEREKILKSRSAFDALGDIQKEEILSAFSLYISGANNLIISSWRKSRMQSPLVQSAFYQFLRESYADIILAAE